MREIKFRVFNTITKQMFYDGFIINDRGKIFFTEVVINDEISEQLKKVYDIDYPSVFDYGDYSFQFCQPMQFTGLKDKNGKEIYSGDLVKQNDSIAEIQDCVGGFNCLIVEGENKGTTFIFSWLTDKICEVIGNKYEN